MAINFTKPMITKLQQEITELENKIKSAQNKKEKSKFKINQLEQDMKFSKSHTDLSSKMSRIKKLNDEIKTLNRMQADLSKELTAKKNSLKKLQVNETTSVTNDPAKG
jgi:predicted  nucleic acid-binding Zn-ribbon protein